MECMVNCKPKSKWEIYFFDAGVRACLKKFPNFIFEIRVIRGQKTCHDVKKFLQKKYRYNILFIK